MCHRTDVVLSVAIGLVAVAVFVLVERRSDHPMIDAALFTDSSSGTVLRIGACVNKRLPGPPPLPENVHAPMHTTDGCMFFVIVRGPIGNTYEPVDGYELPPL